jgi:hypothetical protein
LEQAVIIGTCCGKLNNAKNHIRRTLAYYQGQNKHCEKLYKFTLAKGHNQNREDYKSYWQA